MSAHLAARMTALNGICSSHQAALAPSAFAPVPIAPCDARKDPRLYVSCESSLAETGSRAYRNLPGPAPGVLAQQSAAVAPAVPSSNRSPHGSPISDTSSRLANPIDGGRHHHEWFCDAKVTVSLRPDFDPVVVPIVLLKDANTLSTDSAGPSFYTLSAFRSINDLFLDELEPYCLDSAMKNGAKIIEWVKVAHNIARGIASRPDWEAIKARSRQSKVCEPF